MLIASSAAEEIAQRIIFSYHLPAVLLELASRPLQAGLNRPHNNIYINIK
jgi:hypothetical protein